MADELNRKREQVLPPGTYAFILDGTKGGIKTHVGPVTLTLTAQDRPVLYNDKTHQFDEVPLEMAVRKNVVAPEGYYVVLTNPAKSKDGKDLHPEMGRPSDSPDLLIGQKENLPGPIDFALYPGQTAEVRRGHHLRSNEYLRVKVYNEEKARDNWSKAVVKTTETTTPPPTGDGKAPPKDTPPQVATRQAPKDIAVGKQYNILGTEVSFYIPPTGVSVMAEAEENGRPIFTRDAETLEQLEYAILVDEDGNKEYPKGPSVVFPRPTQRFLTDNQGNRKFRAVEMNELQGIQLKFIAPVSLTFADGEEHDYAAGEEVFIIGKEMPIYYPEEGHQLVKYDGKTIHYAAAVPEGEARYVMDRKSGEIRTVRGPTMLLPNPVNEIIVRRALSDGESRTWFPGSDGNGSTEALEYNRWLRDQAAKAPTTRSGVVSEGQMQLNVSPMGASGPGDYAMGMFSPGGFDQLDSVAVAYASNSPGTFASSAGERGAAPMRQAKSTKMAESRQGKNQDAMLGDVAERKSSFNEPRTLTFANKYKGVPTIKVRQGYAVQVADSEGNRSVHVGPKTLLLDYGETLDSLTLSTGKPKTTDRLHVTAYLNVSNNKVTDVINVETADLVKVDIKLVYNVNFEGKPDAWFSIENYVKHLCDRVRSVLKGKVRRETIERFYGNSTDILRDAILGQQASKEAGGSRPGWTFPENGMRITDVEVLGVTIADAGIGQMLAQAQHQVVQQNLTLAQAKSKLEALRQQEQIKRDEAQESFATQKAQYALRGLGLAEELTLKMRELAANLQISVEQRKQKEVEEALADFVHQQELDRKLADAQFADAIAKEEQTRFLAQLKAQTDAVVEQMKAVDPTLAAALESASARETLVQVSKQLGFHQMFGGENAADFIRKAFSGTPLERVINNALVKAGGNGAGKEITA